MPTTIPTLTFPPATYKPKPGDEHEVFEIALQRLDASNKESIRAIIDATADIVIGQRPDAPGPFASTEETDRLTNALSAGINDAIADRIIGFIFARWIQKHAPKITGITPEKFKKGILTVARFTPPKAKEHKVKAVPNIESTLGAFDPNDVDAQDRFEEFIRKWKTLEENIGKVFTAAGNDAAVQNALGPVSPQTGVRSVRIEDIKKKLETSATDTITALKARIAGITIQAWVKKGRGSIRAGRPVTATPQQAKGPVLPAEDVKQNAARTIEDSVMALVREFAANAGVKTSLLDEIALLARGIARRGAFNGLSITSTGTPDPRSPVTDALDEAVTDIEAAIRKNTRDYVGTLGGILTSDEGSEIINRVSAIAREQAQNQLAQAYP